MICTPAKTPAFQQLHKLATDLAGRRFGRWQVIQHVGRIAGGVNWLCRCTCGVEKRVHAASLKAGLSRSCGCLSRERTTAANKKHGQSWPRTPLYALWLSLVDRCRNPASSHYHRYGARGIRVCERWLQFENFAADMGERPSSKHQLDRINNDGPYAPLNCRWATRIEQMRNTSQNRLITLDGVTHCVAEWSELIGLSASTIRNRLRLGLTPEEILNPALQRGRRFTSARTTSVDDATRHR